MTRWLVNTFPTWVLMVVIVGGYTAFGVVGHRLVRRRVHRIATGAHNELAGRFISVLITMFGFVLAFTIVSLYGAIKTAELNAHQEATLVAQIYRDARVFDEPAASEVERIVGEYVHEVVDVEWDLMAEAGDSEHAWELIDELYVTLQAYDPDSGPRETFYGEAVGKLNDLEAARRERIEEAEEELPPVFLLLIGTGALVLMGFMWLVGSEHHRVNALMIGGLALVVGFNLLLVVVLDHPFAGDIAVSPHVFQEGILSRFF